MAVTVLSQTLSSYSPPPQQLRCLVSSVSEIASDTAFDREHLSP